MDRRCGEVAEWSKAAVLKTADPSRGPGVRIPPSPPALEGIPGDRSSSGLTSLGLDASGLATKAGSPSHAQHAQRAGKQCECGRRRYGRRCRTRELDAHMGRIGILAVRASGGSVAPLELDEVEPRLQAIGCPDRKRVGRQRSGERRVCPGVRLTRGASVHQDVEPAVVRHPESREDGGCQIEAGQVSPRWRNPLPRIRSATMSEGGKK